MPFQIVPFSKASSFDAIQENVLVLTEGHEWRDFVPFSFENGITGPKLSSSSSFYCAGSNNNRSIVPDTMVLLYCRNEQENDFHLL